MKKTLLFCTLLPIALYGQNADTLLYERFETGGASFTLNTSDMNSVDPSVGYNEWAVNNSYTGGTGNLVCIGIPTTFNVPNTPAQPAAQTGNINSGYMHIISDAAVSSGITNSSYLAASGLCGDDENYFTAMAQDVITTGYDSVAVSFLWLCEGAANNFGELYYSTDAGATWTLVTSPLAQFSGNSTWTNCTASLPAFANQTTLRFGFRFVNQVTFTAADPPFSIDEFLIRGMELAAPPVALFGVSDSVICAGECVDYTDLSTGAPASWFWIFQGSSTSFSTDQNPSGVCYPNPGTYTTTLIVTSASGTDTITASSVIVNSPPAGGLPITVVGDTLIAPPGFTSYQWYENLVLISGANDDTLIVTANGNYSVVYTDSTGCSNESITVLINTGMDEVDLSEWNFYPNPVSNILSFTGPKPGDILEINDMTGRIVFKTTVGDGNVNLASLDNGYYFIRIISDTGTSKPRGILKQ